MIFNTGGGGNATRIVTGKSLHLADTAGGKYKNIKLVGASVQDGTPAVSKPVDIVSNKVKSITGFGKNWLPNEMTNQTVNGVSFIKNDDDSITLNGTSNGRPTPVMYKGTLKAGSYIFSQGVYSDSIGLHIIYTENNTTVYVDLIHAPNGKREFTLSEDKEITAKVDVRNVGTVASNVTLYPMIRLASDTDDTYVPFMGINTAELDEEYELNGFNGIYDEIDSERGVRIQRFDKVVLDGSQTMVLNSGSSTGISGSRRFQITCLSGKACANTSDQVKANALCEQATISTGAVTYSAVNQDNIFSIESTFVCLRLSGIATLEDMRTHLQANPVTVVYELAKPIETPLSVDELIAFNKLRAYKSGSTLISGCDMEVEYFLNNKVGQPMADTHLNTAKYILDGATLNIIV